MERIYKMLVFCYLFSCPIILMILMVFYELIPHLQRYGMHHDFISEIFAIIVLSLVVGFLIEFLIYQTYEFLKVILE